MKIGKYIEVLQVASANGGAIYPVLLSDGSRSALVDAGYPGQYESLRAAVEQAGQRVEGLSAVFFTHQDLDHVGCARDIAEAAPDILFIAHEEEAKYIDGTEAPIKAQKRLREARTAQERTQAEQGIASAKERAVRIGQKLGDGEWIEGWMRAVHMPGHTPGHLCYYVPKAKALIAGDALNLADGKLVGPNPVHTYDMDLALESLKKLCAYDIGHIICYHGGVFSGDVKAALREIIGE